MLVSIAKSDWFSWPKTCNSSARWRRVFWKTNHTPAKFVRVFGSRPQVDDGFSGKPITPQPNFLEFSAGVHEMQLRSPFWKSFSYFATVSIGNALWSRSRSQIHRHTMSWRLTRPSMSNIANFWGVTKTSAERLSKIFEYKRCRNFENRQHGTPVLGLLSGCLWHLAVEVLQVWNKTDFYLTLLSQTSEQKRYQVEKQTIWCSMRFFFTHPVPPSHAQKRALMCPSSCKGLPLVAVFLWNEGSQHVCEHQEPKSPWPRLLVGVLISGHSM